MVVERYLNIKIMSWRKVYFNKKRAVLVCFTVVFATLCINIPFLTVNTSDSVNLTSIYDEFMKNNLVKMENEVKKI
jgi:hypothetical protein